MKMRMIGAAIAMSLAVPAIAAAESTDVQYCSALADTYTKYVLSRGSHGAKLGVPVNVGTAMAKCETSDVGWAITQLEQVLKNAKFNLPPRG